MELKRSQLTSIIGTCQPAKWRYLSFSRSPCDSWWNTCMTRHSCDKTRLKFPTDKNEVRWKPAGAQTAPESCSVVNLCAATRVIQCDTVVVQCYLYQLWATSFPSVQTCSVFCIVPKIRSNWNQDRFAFQSADTLCGVVEICVSGEGMKLGMMERLPV